MNRRNDDINDCYQLDKILFQFMASFGLTDNGSCVVQSILIHKTTVIWAEIAVQHIRMPFMTPGD